MDIECVPDVISRKNAIGLIESLGIDPKELLSFKFHYSHIEAEVYALDDKGARYYSPRTDQVATHKVCIKIVDEEFA